MPLRIIRNDITRTKADAIVNTANPNPVVGSGVDSAIYNAAGYEKLLSARKKIGAIQSGDVEATPAFALKAKYIFHAVSPVWQGGDSGESENLGALYKKCLHLAEEKKCRSIAIPLLASGNYKFPKSIAVQIAIKEISSFLMSSDIEVILVLYDSDSIRAGEKIFPDVEKFIDDNYVDEKRGDAKLNFSENIAAVNSASRGIVRQFNSISSHRTDRTFAASPLREKFTKSDLEQEIKNAGKPFDEYLRSLMNKKGMTSVDVCRNGNIDRKYFSKLASNKITPSKQKLLSLAISMKLNLDETTDLLKYMGYAFSGNDITDLVFKFYIQNGKYDIYEINTVLFQYDQKLLFGDE